MYLLLFLNIVFSLQTFVSQDEHRNNNPESNESNVKAWHTNYGTHNDNPKFKPIIDLVLNFCKFASKDYFNCEVDFICFNFWAMMYENGDHTI